MKYIFSLFILFLSCQSLANETALDKATEVARLMAGNEIKQSMIQQFKSRATAIIKQKLAIRPEEKTLLDEYRDNLDALLTEAFNKPALDRELGKIYLEYYSEEELDQIIAFYTSPLGKKMREQSQELSRDVKQAMIKNTDSLRYQLNLLGANFKAKLEGWRLVSPPK